MYTRYIVVRRSFHSTFLEEVLSKNTFHLLHSYAPTESYAIENFACALVCSLVMVGLCLTILILSLLYVCVCVMCILSYLDS